MFLYVISFLPPCDLQQEERMTEEGKKNPNPVSTQSVEILEEMTSYETLQKLYTTNVSFSVLAHFLELLYSATSTNKIQGILYSIC